MNKDSLMDNYSNTDILEITMYPRGVPGYTYTPHIDENGELTWTNNGGLTNPDPINIKGPKGEQGLIEFQIVNELPRPTGDSRVLYLLDIGRSTVDSLYDEYIWIENIQDYELVSEGKRTLNTNAQALLGYYYNKTLLATINVANYLDGGQYALIVDANTTGVPNVITEQTNVVISSYQSANKDFIYQELINFNDNKKYVRIATETNGTPGMTGMPTAGTYIYGEWSLGTSGGIEIGTETPEDSSTVIWIDTSEEGEIFDPNEYYTKTEADAKIVNTLSGGEISKAPSVAAVNAALENVQPEIDLSNYLAKDNEVAYTPQLEYHPATKKYVDDHVPTIDVVDNLNSTSTTKPLSANQGRVLNNKLNNLTFVTLTKSQYNALSTKDENTLYIIKEG